MTDANFYNRIDPVFIDLPDFDEVEYLGTFNEHDMSFKVTRLEVTKYILLGHYLWHEEASLWETSAEILQQALSRAEGRVHGRFAYELLSIDMQQGLSLFQEKEFTQLIVNHAAKCREGETRPVKYCSLHGHLVKYTDEQWGKILFKHHIQVYRKSQPHLDLVLKNLFNVRKNFQQHETFIIFNDLSRHSILSKDIAEQAERLKKMIRKIKADPLGQTTQINVLDHQGRHLLLDYYEEADEQQISFWD